MVFKKGHTSWNKGLTKETSDKVLAYSLKNTGKLRSEEFRKKMRLKNLGRTPWNKRESIILICKQCNKKFTVSYRNRHRKYCGLVCKNKSMVGRKPWNVGISPSKEQIKKQSKSLKKYYETHDGPNLGKKVSEEVIEKLRLAQLSRVDRNVSIDFLQEVDSKWAKLIGYLLSDGYWGKGQSLKFVNNNINFINEVKKLAKEKGFFIAERPKNNGLEIHLKVFEKIGQNVVGHTISEAVWRAQFRDLEIYGRDRLGKILELPEEMQIAFLQGYFNGDGYLWIGKDRSHEHRITRIEIGFCIGIHKTLAEDVQKLLQNFGILSTIKTELMAKSTRPFYRVLVSKRESGKRLIKLLDDSKYPEKFNRAKKLMDSENARFSKG